VANGGPKLAHLPNCVTMPPVPEQQPETRIIECKRCGIRTRHEREEWVQRTLPLLLLAGRVKVVTAWRCTKCGKFRSAQARYRQEKENE
jgi:ribosomal protein L37E